MKKRKYVTEGHPLMIVLTFGQQKVNLELFLLPLVFDQYLLEVIVMIDEPPEEKKKRSKIEELQVP